MCKTEDRIVDLDRACGGGYVSHWATVDGWDGKETGVEANRLLVTDGMGEVTCCGRRWVMGIIKGPV